MCPNLSILLLGQNSAVRSSFVTQVTSTLTQLRELDISECTELAHTDDMRLDLSSNLVKLDLADCKKLNPEAVADLSKRLGCLQLLRKEFCPQTSLDILTLAEIRPVNGMRIDWSEVSKVVTQSDDPIESRSQKIKEYETALMQLASKWKMELKTFPFGVLNFGNQDVISKLDLISTLCPNIEILDINFMIIYLGMAELNEYEAIKAILIRFKQIHTIIFRHIQLIYLDDRLFNMISQLCTNLKSLSLCLELNEDVVSTLKITDAGLKSLSACHHLTKLFLGSVQITDLGIEYLSRHTKFLEVVSLKNCPISDKAIQALLDNCSLLRKIRLHNCGLISSQLTKLSRHVKITIENTPPLQEMEEG
jgi:hypothetical protein